MVQIPDLRPSPIAGRWYPADPKRLAENVDRYLASPHLPMLEGDAVAVVTPHAGHLYSGPVAGWGFAAVRGKPVDLVAVVAPMHYPYPQPLITSSHMGYQTPLGPVFIDQQALAELDGYVHASLGFGLSPVREDPEHSLEIELPFLQRAIPGEFKLLPVMVRDQSPAVAQQLGLALALVLGSRNALLVASTDLSHFFTQQQALRYDQNLLKQIQEFNPQGIFEIEEAGKGFACGKAAVAAVLWAARELGATEVKILKHATSGDVTGDYDQVVGYAAAVCLRYG